MSVRSIVEDVIVTCLPTCPPKYVRWGARFAIEVAIGDRAWMNFADPMTALTHPLFIGESGSQKSMVLRLVRRFVGASFPHQELPATITREATVDYLSRTGTPHGRTMPVAYTVIPELGLLFESNDTTYNKGKKDFLLELLEGHVMGKGVMAKIVNEFPVHCPFICATTPQRLLSIIPSRLDMCDGLPVRFSPVVCMEKRSDDMPPVITENQLDPAIDALTDLQTALVETPHPMKMVHTPQSMSYYDELCKQGQDDIANLRMHPASFGRAKMNFSRICISEEISNHGTSTAISADSAKVAMEDSLESARDMFKLVLLMGPSEDMSLILSLVQQSMPTGIAKTALRKATGLPNKRFTEAYDSLDSNDTGCGLIKSEKTFVKTSPVQLVRLA